MADCNEIIRWLFNKPSFRAWLGKGPFPAAKIPIKTEVVVEGFWLSNVSRHPCIMLHVTIWADCVEKL